MGLLDGLFGENEKTSVDQVADTIWRTRVAKWKGISEEITERVRSNSVAVLLVAHFPDVLERLEEVVALRAAGRPTVDTVIRLAPMPMPQGALSVRIARIT